MATVEIYEHHYKIEGALTTERIRVLARYVDQRMRQVAGRMNTDDALRVAVLAALNIANDYYVAKRALEQREGEIATRVDRIVGTLDEALEPGKEAVGQR